jgi:hypothetical protein
MANVKLAEVQRLAKLDATITETSGAPKQLLDLLISPNQGFTIGATGNGVTLKITEMDPEDDAILAVTTIAIGSSGYLGEYLPACSKVRIQAYVASGSVDLVCRLWPKGVQ